MCVVSMDYGFSPIMTHGVFLHAISITNVFWLYKILPPPHQFPMLWPPVRFPMIWYVPNRSPFFSIITKINIPKISIHPQHRCFVIHTFCHDLVVQVYKFAGIEPNKFVSIHHQDPFVLICASNASLQCGFMMFSVFSAFVHVVVFPPGVKLQTFSFKVRYIHQRMGSCNDCIYPQGSVIIYKELYPIWNVNFPVYDSIAEPDSEVPLGFLLRFLS